MPKIHKKNVKKRKNNLFRLIFIIAIIIVVIYFSKSMQRPTKSPEEALQRYTSYILEKDYEKMYEMLSENTKQKIEKETYISRNKNIYEGIEINDLKLNIVKVNKQSQTAEVIYQATLQTLAGEINYSNTSKFKYEDEEYKLEWSVSDIFPDLKDNYKVRVDTLKAERGKILDRNGTILASKQPASQVGFVPRKNK